jgi:hypothetical protein
MQRVQIHPATDRWMMGDRYGTVVASVKVKGKWVHKVQMDRSGKTVRVPDDLIGTWY